MMCRLATLPPSREGSLDSTAGTPVFEGDLRLNGAIPPTDAHFARPRAPGLCAAQYTPGLFPQPARDPSDPAS